VHRNSVTKRRALQGSAIAVPAVRTRVALSASTSIDVPIAMPSMSASEIVDWLIAHRCALTRVDAALVADVRTRAVTYLRRVMCVMIT
jgi:hypothetical protein